MYGRSTKVTRIDDEVLLSASRGAPSDPHEATSERLAAASAAREAPRASLGLPSASLEAIDRCQRVPRASPPERCASESDICDAVQGLRARLGTFGETLFELSASEEVPSAALLETRAPMSHREPRSAFRLRAPEPPPAALLAPRAAQGTSRAPPVETAASIEATRGALAAPREALVDTKASIVEPRDALERNLAAQSVPHAMLGIPNAMGFHELRMREPHAGTSAMWHTARQIASRADGRGSRFIRSAI